MTPQQESIVFKGIASEILAMSSPRKETVAHVFNTFGYSFNKLIDLHAINQALIERDILQRHGFWVSKKIDGVATRVGQYEDGVFKIHNKILWCEALIELV